jgi:hypothetical protein
MIRGRLRVLSPAQSELPTRALSALVGLNRRENGGPEARAAYFSVARSVCHTVPEEVLGKRRTGRSLEGDGPTALVALHGSEQRCSIDRGALLGASSNRGNPPATPPARLGHGVLGKIARNDSTPRRFGEVSGVGASRLPVQLGR